MIYLLHGDNTVLLETALVELKKKAQNEKLEYQAQDITPAQLGDISRTFDVFSQAPFIVVRFEKADDQKPFYDSLQAIPAETKLVLVFPFNLGASSIFTKNPNKLPLKEASVAKKTTADVFRFLDALFLQKRTLAHKELLLLSAEGNDPFYLFSMVLYGLRTVCHAKFGTDELAQMKDFTKRKALAQAEKFTQAEILALFIQLYELDKQVKTGVITPDLLNFLAVERILAYTKS